MDMERKVFEFKIDDLTEEGEFSGYLSTFGNVDEGGDIVEPGAFKKTLRENNAFPLIIQHSSNLLPSLAVGSFRGEEDSKGLKVNGEFFLDIEEGRKAYAGVKRLLKNRVKVGLSMGYKTLKKEDDEVDGMPVRRLKEVKLFEGSLTLFPMNPLAGVETVKAEWTRAYINDLPNSAFAVIEPAYLKGETEDKRCRHLPHHDKSGAIDEPHLRNALARMKLIKPFTDSISTEELRAKAEKHLVAHAKKLGIGDWDEDTELEGIKADEHVPKGFKSIKDFYNQTEEFEYYVD